MHEASSEHGRHHHHHGQHHCGPEVFYGYCADSKRMRMMDYSDYMQNVRRAYSDMYTAMYRSSMHPWWKSAHPFMAGHKWDHDDCGCGHSYKHPHPWDHHHHHGECDCHRDDCHCSCCIRDADAVEFTHCGERRLIPLLFENDTRRERDVKLELGAFSTASGRELGWQASFSESQFKLPPCGSKTVMLSVLVDCGKLTGQPDRDGTTDGPANERQPSVDECKVGYATVRAEGCRVRPLVVAVAVLPNDCGAHTAGCGCDCCN